MGQPIRWSDIEGRNTIDVPNSNESRICCMFCDDDKFHLYFNLSKKVYNCFKCGTSGKIIFRNEAPDVSRYVSQGEKIREALLYPAEAHGTKVEVIKSCPIASKITSKDDKPGSFVIPRALIYLQNRGLTREEIIDNNLMYMRKEDRILFPVMTYENPQYFVTRRIEDNGIGPKYQNAPWPKGGTLYFPITKHPSSYLAICEGPLDAIRLSRVYPTVALLGKKATYEQLKSIQGLRYNTHLIFLDPDAWSSAVRLRLELGALLGPDKAKRIKIAELESDPGSSTESQLREAGREALDR